MAAQRGRIVNRNNGQAPPDGCKFLVAGAESTRSLTTQIRWYHATSDNPLGVVTSGGCRKSTFEDCNAEEMPVSRRQTAPLFAIALSAIGLSGCGSINEKLSAGVSDAIPVWAGGMPADAPPRPGTAKYDEYMQERERRRLMPAAEREQEDARASETTLEPVH